MANDGFNRISKPDVAIKIMGVGGLGIHVVDRMIALGYDAMDYIAVDTDEHTLEHSHAANRVLLRPVAEVNRTSITDLIDVADMLIIIAGMGGETATGAAPVIARMATKAKVLTVGIAISPFPFEDEDTIERAEAGFGKLMENTDALISIWSEQIFRIVNESMSVADLYLVLGNQIASQYGRCIAHIAKMMGERGNIVLDFDDVSTIVRNGGEAQMGTWEAEGENSIEIITHMIRANPMLGKPIESAKSVLFNITGGAGLSLSDINLIAFNILDLVDPETDVIWGQIVDESMGDDSIRVTLIASKL